MAPKKGNTHALQHGHDASHSRAPGRARLDEMPPLGPMHAIFMLPSTSGSSLASVASLVMPMKITQPLWRDIRFYSFLKKVAKNRCPFLLILPASGRWTPAGHLYFPHPFPFSVQRKWGSRSRPKVG